MFKSAMNKVRWQQILKDTSNEKMKRAISELFIPYNISLNKYGINEECLKKHNSYLYETQESCTASMVYWVEKESIDFPPGFPLWYYPAFPDVAKWTQTEEGRNALTPFFEEAGETLGDTDRRLRIFALKRVIDEFLKNTGRKLEVSI